jgi:hypothetical protein
MQTFAYLYSLYFQCCKLPFQHKPLTPVFPFLNHQIPVHIYSSLNFFQPILTTEKTLHHPTIFHRLLPFLTAHMTFISHYFLWNHLHPPNAHFCQFTFLLLSPIYPCTRKRCFNLFAGARVNWPGTMSHLNWNLCKKGIPFQWSHLGVNWTSFKNFFARCIGIRQKY